MFQIKESQDKVFVSSHARTIPAHGLCYQNLLNSIRQQHKTCVALERKAGEVGRLALYFDAYEILTIQAGLLHSERQATAAVYGGDPLENLQRQIGRYQRCDRDRSEPVPAFAQALIGYLGYDCIQYLENIPLAPTETEVPEACFAVFKNIVIFDETLQTITIVVNAFSDDDRLHADASIRRVMDFVNDCPDHFATPRPSSNSAQTRRPFNATAFQKQVKIVKEHIRSGDVFQCVLSQRTEFESLSAPHDVFEALRHQNPSPYHFYFQSPGQTVVGASPEPLIKIDGKTKTIQTYPIAGTRPRGADRKSDSKQRRNLLASTKEKSEHLMLVDLSRNDLGKICKPGSVKVKEFMRIQNFSHVMHLVSLVEGEIPDQQSAFAALLSCFPAGTLTGAPKVRAMQIIAKLEEERRGLYGGALVMLDFDGNLDSCILIRSLVDNGERCYVQAGAGIVADSKSDREFLEIVHKSASIRRAIGGLS